MQEGIEHLSVSLGERSYDIIIGEGVLEQVGSYMAQVLHHPRVIVVTDDNVAAHYQGPMKNALDFHAIEHDWVTIPPGEGSKSFSTLESVCNQILEYRPDRKTMLVALGGGVVGDLTGFAASIILRGIDYVQIPTTLLSQVDSSVGGKTGINAKTGKNMVGSFHQPRRVLIDTRTLQTLSARDVRAGYAEVVKYGLIKDEDFFHWLEGHRNDVMALKSYALLHAIKTSCEAKAEIVARDEHETGLRMVLNLGHTFGHALEAETGFSDTLLHGEAVALGIVMACRLSTKLGMLEEDTGNRVERHLKQIKLPVSLKDITHEWDVDSICDHLASDKKVENGSLTFILLQAVGRPVFVRDVEMDMVREVIQEFM